MLILYLCGNNRRKYISGWPDLFRAKHERLRDFSAFCWPDKTNGIDSRQGHVLLAASDPIPNSTCKLSDKYEDEVEIVMIVL